MLVLVYWADRPTRETLAGLLRGAGHEVLQVSEAAEALAAVGMSQPQAVVLGPEVRASDGVLVARKSDLHGRGARVLVVLPSAEDERANLYRNLGVNELLFGAVRPGEVLAELERVSDDAPVLTRLDDLAPLELQTLGMLYAADLGNLEGQWLLGFSYYRASEFSRARDCLTRVADGDPTHLEACYYLGSSHYRLGELEEARRRWQRVAHEAPRTPLGKKAAKHLRRLSRSP